MLVNTHCVTFRITQRKKVIGCTVKIPFFIDTVETCMRFSHVLHTVNQILATKLRGTHRI